tara:strand:+ start:2896 stop:3459 length:564 start_codon:yes stop_codon:yes gene_type:complete
MGVINVSDKSIIKVSTLDGSTSKITVTGGNEVIFTRIFRDQPAFYMVRNSAQSLNNNVDTKITYTSEIRDITKNASPGSGTFTVPQYGTYFFGTEIMLQGYAIGAAERYDLTFKRERDSTTTLEHRNIYQGVGNGSNSVFQTLRAYYVTELEPGDTIAVHVTNKSGTNRTTYPSTGNYTKFFGGLMK